MSDLTAYCDLQHIEDEASLGKPLNDTVEPTRNRAMRFAHHVYVGLNAKLAQRGITVPIDPAVSPKAYETIADVNALGAAIKTVRYMYRMGTPLKPPQWLKDMETEYEEQLKSYVDNPKALQDAQGMTSPGICRNSTTSSRALLPITVNTANYEIYRPTNAI